MKISRATQPLSATFKPSFRCPQNTRAQTGKKSKPAERHTLACRENPRFGFRQFQPRRPQLLDDTRPQLPETPFVIGEDKKVVGIAQIITVAFGFSHPMIQSVQVKIPPELACEIADGQAPWARGGRQIISGKQKRRQFRAGAVTRHNPIHQGQRAGTTDELLQLRPPFGRFFGVALAGLGGATCRSCAMWV